MENKENSLREIILQRFKENQIFAMNFNKGFVINQSKLSELNDFVSLTNSHFVS